MNLDAILQLKFAGATMLVCNIIGLAVKKSAWPTWANVWLLPIVGCVVYPLLSQSPMAQLVTDIIYGFIIGGVAVWGHQALTQTVGAIIGLNQNDKDEKKP